MTPSAAFPPRCSKRCAVIAAILAGLLYFLNSGAQVDGQNDEKLAREILEKADRIRFPEEGFQVDVAVANSNAGEVTDTRQYRVLSKGNENSIVMVTEPAADRGQIMLLKGRDLWVFLPNVSQPVRLSLAQRLTGQVANGDIARANFTGDYTPKLVRTEKIDGEDHYVLELTAVDRTVTYHRVMYWVRQKNFFPHKAEFYSLSDRLLKTAAMRTSSRWPAARGQPASSCRTRCARARRPCSTTPAWCSRTCQTRSSRGTT